MKLILCAVDFSPASINSARYAAGLSIALEAKIILVHVYEPPVMYMDVPMTDLRDADGLLLEAVEKKVQSLGIKLMKEFKGLRCEARLLKGIAAEQIVGICGKQNADLLVIGSTGGSRLIRMLMGSTSSRLIRETNCPVLCVPGKAEFNDIHKIVFATDLHEDNIQSAMTIAAFAKVFDAEIAFLFVDDKHLLHDEEWMEGMTRKIRKRVKYPKLSGYISKSTTVTKGIEYFIRKFPADMLVMFTHPRHFPENMYHSSMTQIMSHQSQVPLLVLKRADVSISEAR